jgi:uncharacterized protein YegP (UPF0339 family)
MPERDEVDVYEDASGEFRWRRQAGNERIISDSSESYTRREDAERAAQRANPDLYPDSEEE